MTYLDLPRPAPITRATVITFARNPVVERTLAAVILFAVGFGFACQIGA